MKKHFIGLMLILLLISSVVFAGDVITSIYDKTISSTTATLISGIKKGRKELRIRKGNDTYEMRIATYSISFADAENGYILFLAGDEFKDNFYVALSSWYIILATDTVTGIKVSVMEKQ